MKKLTAYPSYLEKMTRSQIAMLGIYKEDGSLINHGLTKGGYLWVERRRMSKEYPTEKILFSRRGAVIDATLYKAAIDLPPNLPRYLTLARLFAAYVACRNQIQFMPLSTWEFYRRQRHALKLQIAIEKRIK